MYIPRHIVVTIKERLKNYPIVLITGARQVGKSFMLMNEFPTYERVSLADAFIRKQATEDPGLFFKQHPAPLIIDEIQLVPSLFREVMAIVDAHRKDGQYIFTGSQKYELLRGVSESLAGRVAIIEMNNLSLRELFDIQMTSPFIPTEEYLDDRKNKLVSYHDVFSYIFRGGYPKIYQNDIQDVESYYSNYVKTYLEKDVRGFIKPQHEIDFYKFLVSLATRSGEKINYHNIAVEIGMSEPTIKSWISVLEASNIIYILHPYHSKALTRTIKTPKIYFRDTGLLCYLSGWLTRKAMERGHQSDYIFETFVVSEIIKSFENFGREYQNRIFYYSGFDKTKRNAKGEVIPQETEIDLIIDYDHTLYPIEIKKASIVSRTKATAFDVLKQEKEKDIGLGIIICNTLEPILLKENLMALPIEYI